MQNIVLLVSAFIVFFKIKVSLYDLQLFRICWRRSKTMTSYVWLINEQRNADIKHLNI